MNNKGVAVLEIITTIAIFAVLVIMVSSFKTYIANHEAEIIKETTFYAHIDTELTNLYSEEWDYQDKIIETKTGPIEMAIENLGRTEYNTNSIEVTFKQGELEKTYKLERSEYYE